MKGRGSLRLQTFISALWGSPSVTV